MGEWRQPGSKNMFTYKGLNPKEKIPTKQITFSLMFLGSFLFRFSSKEEGCFS